MDFRLRSSKSDIESMPSGTKTKNKKKPSIDIHSHVRKLVVTGIVS